MYEKYDFKNLEVSENIECETFQHINLLKSIQMCIVAAIGSEAR
jgi:hypothetical protein